MSARREGKWIFFALLVLIAASVFLLNLHTPLMNDDYDYSFSWATGERLASVGDILASQAAHYHLWGGRSVVHFLAQLFLMLGKPVFNVANAAMYVMLLLEIYALGKKKGQAPNAQPLLIAHALLMLTVPFFGVAFLWLDGACNYLWGTALALVPLLIARSEREGGFFDTDGPRGLLALPLCFLAGWTNENAGCGILAALLFLMIWDRIKRRKLRAWRIAAWAFEALGVAVMLLAPGNFARAGELSSRGLIMELAYRFAVVFYCVIRYAAFPVGAALVIALWARRHGRALAWERLALLGGAAFLCAYALVGSPQISDRSFTIVVVLAIAALLCTLQAERCNPRVLAALLLVTAALTIGALEDVKAHERAWLAQTERIEAAAQAGEESVTISGVESRSRFTMDVAIGESPDVWPNSTLSKYYGVRIEGESAE